MRRGRSPRSTTPTASRHRSPSAGRRPPQADRRGGRLQQASGLRELGDRQQLPDHRALRRGPAGGRRHHAEQLRAVRLTSGGETSARSTTLTTTATPRLRRRARRGRRWSRQLRGDARRPEQQGSLGRDCYSAEEPFPVPYAGTDVAIRTWTATGCATAQTTRITTTELLETSRNWPRRRRSRGWRQLQPAQGLPSPPATHHACVRPRQSVQPLPPRVLVAQLGRHPGIPAPAPDGSPNWYALP